MPREILPPDDEALAKWRELPQNEPSRDALPPMTGGTRLAWFFLAALVVVIIVVLLQGRVL